MRIIVFALIIGLFAFCSKPQKTPYLTYTPLSYSISKVELYRLNKGYELFDRAERNDENNRWAFRADSVPQGIYQLRIDNTTIIPLLLEGTMPSSITYANQDLIISGNPQTETLWKAHGIIDELSENIKASASAFPDSMESEYFNHYRDSVFQWIETQKNKSRKSITQLIERNKSSLLPLILVQLKAGNHHIYNFKTNTNMYFKVDEYLKSYNPNYLPVKDFNSRVDSLRSWIYYTSVTNPGKALPDLHIPNAWGDPIPLSRFKGKNTMYLVWNSESDESRIITKQLMSWTRKYRYKGLDLCLISTDTNKDLWQNAIKADNLPVWHLSDLKGKASPILAGLGLTQVPTMILVDKEGIILARSSDQSTMEKALNNLIQK